MNWQKVTEIWVDGKPFDPLRPPDKGVHNNHRLECQCEPCLIDIRRRNPNIVIEKVEKWILE